MGSEGYQTVPGGSLHHVQIKKDGGQTLKGNNHQNYFSGDKCMENIYEKYD